MSNVQDTATQKEAFHDIMDASDAILKRWEDAEEPSQSVEQEATDETLEKETIEEESEITTEDEEELEEVEEDDEDPVSDEETEEEDEPEEDQEDDETEVTLSEDALVEIQVDGESQQVSLKSLKRLHGQEASLTRKSQEVAARRKEADEALSKADISYRKLLERAESRLKPYAEVDMLVASRQMSSEDFAAFRKEAKAAEDDLKFLKEEADVFYREANASRQEQLQKQANECVKVLEDNLEGWNNEMYNNIRSYAVSQGLPQEQVDQYVDPQVIMILNKARLYDQTKASAQVKKAKAKVIKTKNSSGKILKTKKAPSNDTDLRVQRQRKAVKKLRSNASRAGDLDDIADALLSRWEQ